ncbi:MAG: hypothetical protein HC893_00670 [Chloroflexaceae bacterium]|nr:hypothetical protein [Chloroflexaceae bacterium]NJO04376.1 hypothetical protein [Chloroflexaceae bacterium]
MIWLLLVCLTATLYMVGLIWFVQIVHYPLFALVGRESFLVYHAAHSTRVSLVVIGPMLVELGSSLALALAPPQGVPVWLAWLGAVLVLAIWALTFLVQSPQHGAMAGGYSPQLIQALVANNWWRTLAWTLHGGVVMWMVVAAWQARIA